MDNLPCTVHFFWENVIHKIYFKHFLIMSNEFCILNYIKWHAQRLYFYRRFVTWTLIFLRTKMFRDSWWNQFVDIYSFFSYFCTFFLQWVSLMIFFLESLVSFVLGSQYRWFPADLCLFFAYFVIFVKKRLFSLISAYFRLFTLMVAFLLGEPMQTFFAGLFCRCKPKIVKIINLLLA